MDLKLVKETDLTVDDIAKFILNTPSEVFKTAFYWSVNSVEFIRRLYDENFIMVFVDNKSHHNIYGLCVWACINESDKHFINKVRWTLPDDVRGGKILYIGLVILTMDCEVWQIKDKLEELGYRKKIKEVLWFTDNRWRTRKVFDGNI